MARTVRRLRGVVAIDGCIWRHWTGAPNDLSDLYDDILMERMLHELTFVHGLAPEWPCQRPVEVQSCALVEEGAAIAGYTPEGVMILGRRLHLIG